MEKILLELTKQISRFNDSLKPKALNLDDIREQQESLKYFLEIKHDLEHLLNSLKNNSLDNVEENREILVHLHIKMGNLNSCLDNLHENLKKIIASYSIEEPQYPASTMNCREKEQIIIENDVYILETVGARIITNDGYRGISIYDDCLKAIKNIFLFEDIIIDRVYKHPFKNEIILYCYENQFLVWIDLESYLFTTIPLPSLDQNIYFSPMYEWNDEKIIFITYSDDFYVCDIKGETITLIKKNIVKTKYPKLFNFWNIAHQYQPAYFLPIQQQFVVDDSENHVVRIINSANVTEETIQRPNLDFHDIIKANGRICFISEAAIELINIKDEKILLLKPQKNYEFYRARFLEQEGKMTLITLSGNYTRLGTESVLALYNIE